MTALAPDRQRLQILRAKRTRAASVVSRSMHHLLTDVAKWGLDGRPVGPEYQGLPSWWPFWSDVLRDNVIELVRAARRLEAAEASTQELSCA
ncbi:MAG: hypothetical protein V4597_08330 [Pseudomonadota bacterium]